MKADTSKRQYKKTKTSRLPETVKYKHLAHLSKPVPITGSDITKISEIFSLHLTETSLMLGLNASSLYEKKKKDEILPANISILLRIYMALPQYMPDLEPPSISALISKIQEIDPEFYRPWIGMLLGLEKNSSFRLSREGIEHGSQTTKIMCHLIYKVICDNPKNWFLIREIIEVEAAARNISPPESVWSEGGWNKNLKKTSTKPAPEKNKIRLNSKQNAADA